MNNVFGNKRAVLVFVGPALLIYTVIMLVPVLWSLGYTLFTGSVITGFEFSGLDNFAKLFSDPKVGEALLFTLKYAVILTVGQVLVGYALSLLYVFWLRKASSLVRTLVFFPIVLPTVAVSLLFQKMFEVAPQNGIVNEFINLFGLPSVDWFGSPDTAFLVLVVMDIWRSMGFYAVLLYAGLLDIPEEVMESARLDGAGGWTLIRRIVIPMSLPVLLSSIIFSINGTLKVFDSVLALTNGGPGSSTTPLTLLMFRTAFSYGDYGYGSTIALLLTVICLLVTIFIFRSSRRDLTKG
ncbi:carbohydrate ABC transporter permease [Herbiconiux flava]|uniref:Multiple sugar transport system permease protein/raffinose/stachyose/melibiose transport system permease protein n=1 Tax=Herbiconiux flava TaxID=881268 RepID=A0A852SMU4_9MICO|nr:sugar ABC transporter permease [Herbiconiux flava]NYD70141.1 multiple sugar transport system permease protein/raffinose/stachyose/melibiose transport system permease protein [Herbiconiux flava]GLK16893.1 ABC transporter permease [Herbiconiux flava]